MTQAFYYVNVVIPIGIKDFTFRVCGNEVLRQGSAGEDLSEFELTNLSCPWFSGAAQMLNSPDICDYIKQELREIKRTKGSLISLDNGLINKIKD